jgi:hypothetical protein
MHGGCRLLHNNNGRPAQDGLLAPCSSGSRSDGLQLWNAPEQMKRMWSVLMLPYLRGSRRRLTAQHHSVPTLRGP